MPGKGEIAITGSMRNVMKEAAQTAVSLVRSRAERLGLDPEWLRTIDLHVHVPRGGSARDAASVGLADVRGGRVPAPADARAGRTSP